MQRKKSLTQTCARVLREKLGRKVDSKSIASSRPDRQVVLSQPEKRDDGYGTRSRVEGKEYDDPLAQVGETMRSKVVYREMAELESRWVTRACLDRMGEKGEDVVGVQQLELNSTRSGGPRRMINGSEMDLPCSRVCPGKQEDRKWSR